MLRRIANLTGVEPNVILQVRARFVTTWPTSVPLRSQSMVASAATRSCDTRLDQAAQPFLHLLLWFNHSTQPTSASNTTIHPHAALASIGGNCTSTSIHPSLHFFP